MVLVFPELYEPTMRMDHGCRWVRWRRRRRRRRRRRKCCRRDDDAKKWENNRCDIVPLHHRIMPPLKRPERGFVVEAGAEKRLQAQLMQQAQLDTQNRLLSAIAASQAQIQSRISSLHINVSPSVTPVVSLKSFSEPLHGAGGKQPVLTSPMLHASTVASEKHQQQSVAQQQLPSSCEILISEHRAMSGASLQFFRYE